MKTITNEKVSYEVEAHNPYNGAKVVDDKGKTVTKIVDTDYANLILDSIKRPVEDPQRGFTYNEIDNIDEIKTAIKAEKDGKIQFENATFKFIAERVDSMRWGVPDISFSVFKKYIKKVEETKEEKSAKK